ncbi:Abi family protein [Blastococcus tunisiensis]|uniref:Abi-like protein n=1 Tax=Blastococcus tunisiensis TaxID=1798228 RepID=A0A1I2AIS3_9ACTN|nr:Abi family protein [Blastococcus sp. DSM 46838]SFE43891.1 Abi-like protein [Blastococcus sp. DSM 46838]
MTTPTPAFPPAGRWVEAWLSGPRFAVYLAATGADRDRALALYEWNAQLSAALMHDLAHVEVGLRNAYDVALSARWPGPPHWTLTGDTVFAPVYRKRGRRRVDVNNKTRDSLRHAIANAGGRTAPPGKIVAELMFGFWRYLSSAAHEKTLWVPALHRAFPPGTDRAVHVDGPVGRLHDLRNRVAHHEPLLTTDVAGRLADLIGLAARLDAPLGQHVRANSTVSKLLAARP